MQSVKPHLVVKNACDQFAFELQRLIHPDAFWTVDEPATYR